MDIKIFKSECVIVIWKNVFSEKVNNDYLKSASTDHGQILSWLFVIFPLFEQLLYILN